MEKIHYPDLKDEEIRNFLGPHDAHLIILSDLLGKEISFRENSFYIKDCSESELNDIKTILDALRERMKVKELEVNDINYMVRKMIKEEETNVDLFEDKLVGRSLSGKAIYPKTKGQYELVSALEKYPIVFSIGPAGTGKTFLSVIYAVSALKRNEVKKIVLTRPAVEAGENLGFLPGDLKEKVDPYLTPLYDALNDMLGKEAVERQIERGTIEIAPLAYMRGRTLDDAFVILDEAQNTTSSQMKMFLTRLGFHSQMVITGDITQIDLPHKSNSGLIEASNLLKDMKEIGMVYLTSDDVVRHPLVQKIIDRYDEKDR